MSNPLFVQRQNMKTFGSMSTQRPQDLSIYWDYDSTRNSSAASTVDSYHHLVGNIRSACLEYGLIKSFRAYGNLSGATPTLSPSARSALSLSGVTVIDLPEEGERDAGVKVMLVDVMAHAWDYPTSHTYVVISNDRSVGYALSMLRMRKAFVILISSILAHADLTANASLKLDWSRISLGIHNDPTALAGCPEVNPSSPQLPSSAFRPTSPGTGDSSRFRSRKETQSPNPQKHVGEEHPELVELQHLPPPRTRSRNHSVFSSHEFDTFGGFADIAFSPKVRSLSRGNGTPFSSSKAVGEHRARPESVTPNTALTSSLSKSVFPPFLEDEYSSSRFWKGKDRDDSAHVPGPHNNVDAQSKSVFGPFHESLPDMHASSTTPFHYQKDQTIQDILTSTTSSSSSTLSMVHHSDTTPLTSVVTGTTTAKDVSEDLSSSKMGATLLNTQSQGDFTFERSRLSSTEDSISTVKAEKATSPILAPRVTAIAPNSREETPAIAKASPPSLPLKTSLSQVLQPSPTPITLRAPQLMPSPKARVPSPQAAPSTVKAAAPSTSKLFNVQPPPPSAQLQVNNIPNHFLPLVAVLRRRTNAIAKSELGSLLVKENERVYQLAGVQKFATYISMAVAAGIVSETRRKHDVALQLTYR